MSNMPLNRREKTTDTLYQIGTIPLDFKPRNSYKNSWFQKFQIFQSLCFKDDVKMMMAQYKLAVQKCRFIADCRDFSAALPTLESERLM